MAELPIQQIEDIKVQRVLETMQNRRGNADHIEHIRILAKLKKNENLQQKQACLIKRTVFRRI